MTTPDEVESQHTLMTAAARYDELRTRDALAPPLDAMPAGTPLTREETLEMLALGEVIARKAGYGRQLAVRTARAAGATWSQIGAALGTSKQSAWEAHLRWIEDQAEQHRRSGYEGLDDEQTAAVRTLAGEVDGRPAR
jgi:hypothetical protein